MGLQKASGGTVDCDHDWASSSVCRCLRHFIEGQHRDPLHYPGLEPCDSDLRLGISVTLCWGGKIIEIMSTRLWSYTVTPTLPNTSPPTPPWSLHTLMMTPPTQVPSIVSRQRGGLAQTAAICRKHCAGRSLAASGSLISCTQLFPFVTVDCGWALCWGVGLWAGVGSGAGGVNRLCVCAITHTYRSNEWFLKRWGLSFSLKHYCTAEPGVRKLNLNPPELEFFLF